jgi:hypothetical protein
MSDALLIQKGLQHNTASVALVFSNVFRESYQKYQRMQEGTGIHQILTNICDTVYLKWRTQNSVIRFEELVGLEPVAHGNEHRYTGRFIMFSVITRKRKDLP